MTDRLEVFTVREDKNGGKGFWVRIGTAFATKQGGWSVKLDALPANAELVMMPPRQNDAPKRQGSSTPNFPDGDSDIPF